MYRSPLSDARALDELERCAGTQFDPAVVAAFSAELCDAAEVDRSELEAVAA